jgi:hypothetical protein
MDRGIASLCIPRQTMSKKYTKPFKHSITWVLSEQQRGAHMS